MLWSLDIETACAQGCKIKCNHALIPHMGRPTLWGVMSYTLNTGEPGTFNTPTYFEDIPTFNAWLAAHPDALFVGHRLVFDFKFLITHGAALRIDQFEHCTALAATASYKKIPPAWLEDYERQRQLQPRGVHRKAGQHSLKTLAPYHLGVPPFWETADHADREYLAKDLEYPLRLLKYYETELRKQDTWEFYRHKLLPWQRNFLEAELRGVRINLTLLEEKEWAAHEKLRAVRAILDKEWAAGYRAYQDSTAQVAASAHVQKTRARKTLDEVLRALPPFNLDSPKQMAWLLRDHLGLDIRDFKGKESTGVEVLERLAAEGRQDCALYLNYREQEKLVTAFFPKYRDLQRDGAIHANFNLDIAKTGRTSSDTPNLQQVPGHLHDLFVARPGYKLITKDLSAIEPSYISYYSEDEILYALLASGADFHGHCTNVVFGQNWDLKTLKKEHPAERAFVKEMDLSVFYGAGKNRVKQSSHKHGFNFTLEQADRAVKALRGAWPEVTRFKQQVDELAEEGPLKNFWGRKRLFAQDEIYMTAFNSVIQGSASDHVLQSVDDARLEFKKRGIDAHVLFTVHDEMVVEARADQAAQADEIITWALTHHELPTRHGLVPLRVEGHIADFWSK